MRLDTFTRRLAAASPIAPALAARDSGTRWLEVAPGARPILVAGRWLVAPQRTLILTTHHDRVQQWIARLTQAGVPADHLHPLPSGLSVLFEDAAPETVALSDRLGALGALVGDEPHIVVASVSAALERTLDAETLRRSSKTIRRGGTLDAEEFLDRLAHLGYEPAEPVRVPGQFARRGGIIDVFPMGADRPLRIDLFGDEIESMRTFDPMTQRSLADVEAWTVAAGRETHLPPPGFDIRGLIEPTLELEASQLEDEPAALLRQNVNEDLDALERGVYFNRLDLYRSLLQPDGPCALDLLGDEGWLVLDEPLELEMAAQRSADELGQALEHRAARGEILRAVAHDFLVGIEHAANFADAVAMSHLNAVPAWWNEGPSFALGLRGISYEGQAQALTQSIRNWVEGGLQVFVATDQPNRARKVLEQVELFASTEAPDEGAGIFLVEGNPAGGFVAEKAGLALVTDQELFGVQRLKLPQRKFNEGLPVATVLDLKPGDYVVHITFGIGVYRGLVKREQDGIEKEFLLIEYKAPDKLFLPADQLDRIQKYLAPGDAVPKINRLTGGEWKKTVGKAREDAREMARELIRLYAKRRATTRPAYREDSPEQAEMEHTFPWVETRSQLAAVQEVKEDMELPYPMDRLVCGDVGFGKTEVAIRAAFKAVDNSRQVAVLCPTTILSEQHARNFRERLEPFGVRVELINRFRTAAERRDVEAGLKDGSVHVVVGTHALLNKSLSFRDLGLLIVDEEQKFGVRHKEMLKQMRVNVDILSMTATPIPRTLSMALMQIRPMSLINDPPPGRLPIRSYVRPYSSEVVREALLRELARGGQVYYVSNRVEGIYHVAERVRELVPTARVAVAHGQMTESELEPVMVGFVRGEVDILVSTTIVENGLDISNANTIIVENADKFGLSQLYQLRGRVGRSDRQAYAYMLYGNHSMTEGAMARLDALQEFAHLGSGYSLAFRDLQIRGAGDLLGSKQSGQMQAVGYELYTQLIESEVKFLKSVADGEDVPEFDDPLIGLEPLPTIDLPIHVLIPGDYIQEEAQRLFYYQRIMGARSEESLDEVKAEIEDRYGRLPSSVRNGLSIMRLRLLAQRRGIEKVNGHGGRILVVFRNPDAIPPRLVPMLQQKSVKIFRSGDDLVFPFEGDALHAARESLRMIDEAMTEMDQHRAALAAN